jgi:hypothetical protein
MGLISFVPTLCESEDKESLIITPLGWGESNMDEENNIGKSYHKLGYVMLETIRPVYSDSINNKGGLVPVPKHKAAAHLFGISRLTFRPHTSMTAAWMSGIHERQAIIETNNAMTENLLNGGLAISEHRHQGVSR